MQDFFHQSSIVYHENNKKLLGNITFTHIPQNARRKSKDLPWWSGWPSVLHGREAGSDGHATSIDATVATGISFVQKMMVKSERLPQVSADFLRYLQIKVVISFRFIRVDIFACIVNCELPGLPGLWKLRYIVNIWMSAPFMDWHIVLCSQIQP